jgi:hypothetical protein
MSRVLVGNEGLFVNTKYRYDNGRMAVELFDGDGLPYATLSVNLPDAPELGPNEFYAKTWSENAPLRQPALDSGLFEDTGRRWPLSYVRTGFVEAEVWRLKVPADSATVKALALIRAILETVSEVPTGVPSGLLYTFWMSQGGTLAAYTTMMNNLVGAGWLTCSNNVYRITDKGRVLVARMQSQLKAL